MRRFQYYSGGQSSGKGCGIYLVIMLLIPIMAFITSIGKYLFWIGLGLVILMFVSFYLLDKNDIEEEEEIDV